MTERVEQGGDPAVGLVLRLALDLGTFVGRPADRAVDVVDLEVQRVAVRPAWLGCVDTALQPRGSDSISTASPMASSACPIEPSEPS